jgi:protein TonB
MDAEMDAALPTTTGAAPDGPLRAESGVDALFRAAAFWRSTATVTEPVAPEPPAPVVTGSTSAPTAPTDTADPTDPTSTVPGPPPVTTATPVAARPVPGNEPPRYPRGARRRGYEGTVLLSVEVSQEGDVLGCTVKRSSGHRLLDEAAAEAVAGWRFTPGRDEHGAIEASVVTIPVQFRLQ